MEEIYIKKRMLTQNQKQFAGLLYACPFQECVSSCLLVDYRNNIPLSYISNRVKKFANHEIESALRAHEKCFNKRSEDLLLSKIQNKIEIKKNLTERQLEVVKLICKNHTNNDVAEKLNISPFTAANHRRNAYKQLGISNVKELRYVFSKHEFF